MLVKKSIKKLLKHKYDKKLVKLKAQRELSFYSKFIGEICIAKINTYGKKAVTAEWSIVFLDRPTPDDEWIYLPNADVDTLLMTLKEFLDKHFGGI